MLENSSPDMPAASARSTHSARVESSGSGRAGSRLTSSRNPSQFHAMNSSGLGTVPHAVPALSVFGVLADVVNGVVEQANGPSVQYEVLADEHFGTFQCLDRVRDSVLIGLPPDYDSAYTDPWIQQIAAKITDGAASETEEAQRILDFAKSLEYEPHPPGEQVLMDAKRSIQIGRADCVSLTALILTLAAARGFPVRMVVQYYDDEQAFSHVAPEIYVDGRWVVADAVAKDKPLDWLQPLPPNGFNAMWEVT